MLATLLSNLIEFSKNQNFFFFVYLSQICSYVNYFEHLLSKFHLFQPFQHMDCTKYIIVCKLLVLSAFKQYHFFPYLYELLKDWVCVCLRVLVSVEVTFSIMMLLIRLVFLMKNKLKGTIKRKRLVISLIYVITFFFLILFIF